MGLGEMWFRSSKRGAEIGNIPVKLWCVLGLACHGFGLIGPASAPASQPMVVDGDLPSDQLGSAVHAIQSPFAIDQTHLVAGHSSLATEPGGVLVLLQGLTSATVSEVFPAGPVPERQLQGSYAHGVGMSLSFFDGTTSHVVRATRQYTNPSLDLGPNRIVAPWRWHLTHNRTNWTSLTLGLRYGTSPGETTGPALIYGSANPDGPWTALSSIDRPTRGWVVADDLSTGSVSEGFHRYYAVAWNRYVPLGTDCAYPYPVSPLPALVSLSNVASKNSGTSTSWWFSVEVPARHELQASLPGVPSCSQITWRTYESCGSPISPGSMDNELILPASSVGPTQIIVELEADNCTSPPLWAQINLVPPASNDEPCSATLVAGPSYTQTGRILRQALPTPNHYGILPTDQPDVWYRIQVPIPGSLVAATFSHGGSYGGLDFYYENPCELTEFYNDWLLATDPEDRAWGGMEMSPTGTVVLGAGTWDPNQTVWLRVSGEDQNNQDLTITITPPPPPPGSASTVTLTLHSLPEALGGSKSAARLIVPSVTEDLPRCASGWTAADSIGSWYSVTVPAARTLRLLLDDPDFGSAVVQVGDDSGAICLQRTSATSGTVELTWVNSSTTQSVTVPILIRASQNSLAWRLRLLLDTHPVGDSPWTAPLHDWTTSGSQWAATGPLLQGYSESNEAVSAFPGQQVPDRWYLARIQAPETPISLLFGDGGTTSALRYHLGDPLRPYAGLYHVPQPGSIVQRDLYPWRRVANGLVQSWTRTETTATWVLARMGSLSTSSLQSVTVHTNEPQFVDLAAGWQHILVHREDGRVYGLGANWASQLGQGLPSPTTQARLIPNLPPVVLANANVYSSYYLLEDGTVWTVGSNTYGNLGNNRSGSTIHTPMPVRLQNDAVLDGIVRIGSGAYNLGAITPEGRVYLTGANMTGQLANGQTTTTNQNFATVALATANTELTGVVTLAGGMGFFHAAMEDQTVRAWGYGNWGVLGAGFTGYANPYPISVLNPEGTGPLTNIIDVAAGYCNAWFLEGTGRVLVTGDDWHGNLGRGSYQSPNWRVYPGYVRKGDQSLLEGIVGLATGSNAGWSMVRDHLGQIWTWGTNTNGALAANDTNLESRPYADRALRLDPVLGPVPISGAVRAWANQWFGSVVLIDNTLWIWGWVTTLPQGQGPQLSPIAREQPLP